MHCTSDLGNSKGFYPLSQPLGAVFTTHLRLEKSCERIRQNRLSFGFANFHFQKESLSHAFRCFRCGIELLIQTAPRRPLRLLKPCVFRCASSLCAPHSQLLPCLRASFPFHFSSSPRLPCGFPVVRPLHSLHKTGCRGLIPCWGLGAAPQGRSPWLDVPKALEGVEAAGVTGQLAAWREGRLVVQNGV